MKEMELETLQEHPENPIIRNAKHYVDHHLDHIISLAETANYCYVSPGYLSRLFIKETGEGFSAYITNIKVEKAKKLLEESDCKVSEIGFELGFQETAYFIKTFKKHVGMTPGQYRSAMTTILSE